MMLLPIILSGGIGSRLWPMSRETHPKPFIKLNDGQSLLQKTYLRANHLPNVQEIVTVTNRELYFYSKDEFEQVADKPCKNTFLLEPIGRNSTAAIAIAAQYARTQHDDKCVLLVMPADHLIDDRVAFAEAVNNAHRLAQQGKLVTFGIKPNAPKTEFGYIEVAGNQVVSFVEKPDLPTAEHYLASGNFLWNSGMFCMQAGSFLAELEKLCPDIATQSASCFARAKHSGGADGQQYELQDDFAALPNISVDYAIFEKSNNLAIVPCDMGWSDIGSWTEFGALYPSDKFNNHASGNVLLEDTENCIIHGEDKLIVTLGVENLIVADTADALLIADKKRAQDVRNIVDILRQNNSLSYKEFPTMHRPWGSYTVLQEGASFKLKRIEVKPGKSLSLQSHQHRSEHWVVISGVATVTNGDEIIELQHNQSTYIPIGNKHRLQNLTQQPIMLIEVQCGDYLGEDDITRYEDIYGRAI